jgi:hypothetical protein
VNNLTDAAQHFDDTEATDQEDALLQDEAWEIMYVPQNPVGQ